MIKVRRADDRLHTSVGWLDSRHTFSFAEHHDPRYMGFRALRVLNEDRIAPARGFGMQPHRDLEIVTCVLEGTLRHEDSLGGIATLEPGGVQRLSTGTGVLHSEFNASPTEFLHVLQLWLTPAKARLRASYDCRQFPVGEQSGLRLIASRDGRGGSLRVQQDVALFFGRLRDGDQLVHPLDTARHAWIHVVRGSMILNNTTVSEGDGAEVADEAQLVLKTMSRVEFIVCDLA